MPKILHLVHFKFFPEVEEDTIRDVCQHFIGLKDACIHPTTNQPYIVSTMGGKDNSPEGLQRGYSHCFVFEFSSFEDRDYYIKHDPAHMAFGTYITGKVEDMVMVMDFVPGIF
ncbi:stress responsive A/B barrel domain-containing protein [Talaromyces proteolyticus]|uniref:Stress responsive A/B barrel domain-containing protein n=1 Tax=Talaromyces proteolyticus TaxID=1131652 RepID=A0AAD4Q535_9EURO|nr:stress responsive A/B barrel domain-containing protein [Talaromyces proteolyticus]KAH8703625.1 stress responsive A/B barrel domain-containing protein [Talaromyces proteolyticus]